MLFWLC